MTNSFLKKITRTLRYSGVNGLNRKSGDRSGLHVMSPPESFPLIATDPLIENIRHQNKNSVPGYCAVCEKKTDFLFSPALVQAIRHQEYINWREDLPCCRCGFSARMRATVDILRHYGTAPVFMAGDSYITEAVTPLYSWLKQHLLPQLEGSEFLGSDKIPGQLYPFQSGLLRHEDVTRLSFADASVRLLLSFDVLEHVSDFRQALHEFYRVIAPGGACLLTVPLDIDRRHSERRAQINAAGDIEYLQPPHYHGDPLNGKGVLCFHDYGLDFIDFIRQAGFSTIDCIMAQSIEKMYLGHAMLFLWIQKQPAASV